MPGEARPEPDVFAGRAGELEQLLDLVRGAAEGRPGGLIVAGEAGVGKTSLAERVCSEARDAFLCLWGTCLPMLSATVPFLPLMAAGQSGEPAQGRALGDTPPAFDAWLSERCDQQPVLMVVDDLQWADQISLDVLMYVLAGPTSRRLAVVATIRTSEIPDVLRRWLADVRRLPQVRELPLRPLDRVATRQLLTGRLGAPPHESLVDEVFARSLGNPYLATLLVRDLPASATGLPPGLPGQLRDAVARSWLGLSEPARDLTRLVAIAGRPQRAEFLREISDVLVPHVDVAAALRETVRLGVLAANPAGAYWFAHPLLADVLEADMLPEDARSWHAGFASALTRRMEAAGRHDAEYAATLADHYIRAGDLHHASRWALRNADAAESAGGVVEALRLLRRTLDMRPALDKPNADSADGTDSADRTGGTDRIVLLHQLRAVAEAAGALEAELNATDELLELMDSAADPLIAADLLLRRMWLRQFTGQEFAGSEDIKLALRLARDYPESRQYARAMAGMARVEIWRDLPSGHARAAESVALARASGCPATLSYALAAKLMAWCMDPDGRPYDGDPLEDGRLAQSAAAEGRDFYAFHHATVWLANAQAGSVSRDWVEILRQGREELASLGGPHTYIAWLASFEADGLLFLGEWRSCEQRLRLALSATPGTIGDVSCRLVAARLASWQGRQSEAAGHLARAEELFAEKSGFLGLSFDSVRAEVAIARGDSELAFTIAFAGLEQRADLVERLLPTAARAAADQAEAFRDRGEDPAPAIERLDHLRDAYPTVPTEHNPRPSELAHAAAMQSLYLAEQSRGRRDPTAPGEWIDAAQACAAAGLAWDETYARWRAAEACLTSRGDRATARTQLRRAHSLAADLCAEPLREQIEALATGSGIPLASELGATCQREIPDEHTPIPGLTGRENEILRLVVAGYTYREIASTLVISEKTVSAHISNLLRKTRTASRVELSQKYRRLTTGASRTDSRN